MPRKTSRQSTSSLPTWNLNDLFRSTKDPKISKIQHSAMSRAKKFRKKNRGKVDKLASSPRRFLVELAEYSDILQEASKIIRYAGLLHSESATAPGSGAFLQQSQTFYASISHELTFFTLELAHVSKAKLSKIASTKGAESYRNFFQQVQRAKKHQLEEREEQIMSDKSLTGSSVWLRLFGELFAEKDFTLRHKGKVKTLNESATLDTLHHPDRSLRKAGAKALTEGFQHLAPRTTLIYNTLVLDKSINDKYRKYPSPETSRHDSNEIDQHMVDALVESVTSSYKVVQDYYRFKKKLLGYKELYDYDRYAPLVESHKKFSFAKAQKVILDSFERLSPEFREIAELFFKKNWIDAAARPGKRGGAFCAFVTPDLHPYVFMNYSGTIRDVFTLAHELGHAVHAYLMRKHPYLVFDVPLTIAETASVFAEMLLFDHLCEALRSEEEIFALYLGKLESIFATVYRQVSMFLFERDVHTARKKGEISTLQMNALWRVRQQEMFGRSVTLTENYDWWWSYIPHFLHTPFYVYSYAFGELLTLALFARYQEIGAKAFAPKYMELLACGGTKPPKQLLRPLRVDLGSRAVWDDGVGVIQDLLQEAKSLKR
ncbi:MAG: M3 family oligoendopeptidase [Bdellovibrionales bacterium]|nr:M3 family oligoendopeptidase [Bdellovibrionales bacterium]